jgi:2-oxoglutarate ferredoxin oxidoreductase subunit gamma
LAPGKILYDPEMVKVIRNDAPERHIPVAATMISKRLFDNPLFANMIMLGALTRVARLDIDAMRKAMLEIIPRFHEQNVKALKVGYDLDSVRDAEWQAPGDSMNGEETGM